MGDPPLVAAVAANAADVRARIVGAGGGDRVRLVAVTKGFGADAVRAALAAGLTDIGENYAGELAAKAAVVGDAPRWHFIGRIQRNKVRRLAPLVQLWQSVDRLVVGQEIARWQPGAALLVQVNMTGEPQKGGCDPAEVERLVEGLRELGLDVQGLMAIGPVGDPRAARPGFRRLGDLADRLALRERSMGMSDDLEVAIEEGATIVRVGRALFGPRP